MKILLLTDCEDSWSVHSICKTIKKQLPQHDIDIISGNGIGKNEFGVLVQKYNIVHFLYTTDISKFASLIRMWKEKIVVTIANERSLLGGYGNDKQDLEWMMGK